MIKFGQGGALYQFLYIEEDQVLNLIEPRDPEGMELKESGVVGLPEVSGEDDGEGRRRRTDGGEFYESFENEQEVSCTFIV
jgi:hypothetical protein